MAAPTGQLRASRYFGALAVILAIIYALVFFTGDKKPHPKLGMDLHGGTTLTLSATLQGGKAPDPTKLEQARQIIAERVDASGVSEPDVVTEGNSNIVVNVAGDVDQDTLNKLVAPAELRFRQVLKTTPDKPAAASPSASASASPSGSASPSAGAGASAAPGSSATPTPGGTASAAPSGSGAPSASAAPVDQTTEQLRKQAIDKLGFVYQMAQQIQDPTQVDPQTMELLGAFSQLSDQEIGALPATVQYNTPTITCAMLDKRPPGSIHDVNQQAVACDKANGSGTKYLLDKARVIGEDVSDAQFDNNTQQGGWIVTLKFKSSGQDKWTNLTKDAYDNGAQHQVAVVLDNLVVSAPSIREVIPGDAVISGSFTKDDVETLARQLKYGSLPLSFTPQSYGSISPTLGSEQMRDGLLAGAIGLILVVAYCLFYYRALGMVVIASLLVSASIIFGMLVLLGRYQSYSLSLAGIAGFIVAIGITADSFVVFFERLKDEVKDGRTVRSAVPRAWIRARRTILSADTVSFLAAAVLYVLAIGAVKGFAFTLGLSTIIDLVVVFLFTHPLVAVLSRSSAFTSPRISGLGNLRSDKAIAAQQAAPRFGAVRTKES